MRLRSKPESFARISDTESQDSHQDDEMPDAPSEPTGERSGRCVVFAIDFGTTFSSVALRVTDDVDRTREIGPSNIVCINTFPQDPSSYPDNREAVPTESWYLGKPRERLHAEMIDGSENSTSSGQAQSDDSENGSIDIYTPDYHDDEDVGFNCDEYFWGNSVRQRRKFDVTDPERDLRICRSKLFLSDDELTADIRSNLETTISTLKRKRYIKRDLDIITDFLAHLLRHARTQMLQYHHIEETLPLEFVLCVPNAWKRKAYRDMQIIPAQAVKRANFGEMGNASIQNVFFVSEPEAAAACVLSGSQHVEAGDAFLLLDGGGGTVDATTFLVEKDDPLRLKEEGAVPDARLCGSSLLNAHYEKLLRKKLEGEERFLEQEGVTFRGIIDDLVLEFENQIKRNFDYMSKDKYLKIRIPHLREDREKGFMQGHVHLSREEMREVFMKCLKPIAEMMIGQLEEARENGLDVEKVLLIGGFAGSISLQNYLKGVLRKHRKPRGEVIELITPLVPGTAVARGAVLRALRKEDGPARIAQSSYGWLRTEAHMEEPESEAAHSRLKPTSDPCDGYLWVKDTLYWFIQKGDVVPSEAEHVFTVLHTVPADDPIFICRELLYVSDNYHESHYRKSHKMNRGSKIAGSIVVDMTFLVTEGRISPTMSDAEGRGKPHYKLEFDIVVKVSGRNLRFEAKWPKNGGDRVLKSGQTCIAAAFVNGTS